LVLQLLWSAPALISRRPPDIGALAGCVLTIGVGWFLSSQMASARPAAQRAQCTSNLKQIGTVLYEWEAKHGSFPNADFNDAAGPPISWRVAMLPLFNEAFTLDREYRRDKPWDDTANLPLARRDIPMYQCPANLNPRSRDGLVYSAYALLTGPGTIFPSGRGISSKSISDRAANTMLVAEACGLNIVWTEPRDVDVSREVLAVNATGSDPNESPSMASSCHESPGANVMLADGVVRYLSVHTDPNVLKALTTAAIECKAGRLTGAARIGRVTFSKTGKTLYYRGRQFRSLKGDGFKSNYYEVDSGDEYWISGCRRDGADRLYGESTPVEIDEDVREEYWTEIRKLPAKMRRKTANL
jgi:hypothetical protein